MARSPSRRPHDHSRPARRGSTAAGRDDLRRHPGEDCPDSTRADRHPADPDGRGPEPHAGPRRAADLRQARRPHRAWRWAATSSATSSSAWRARWPSNPMSFSSGSTSSRTRRDRRSGACNRLGLRTVLVLEGARPREVQGNLLVDYLLGAEIHFASDRPEQRRMLDRLAEDCRQRGRAPAHPERQSDVRRRLGDRLPGDDDGDARAARRRRHGADRRLHVVLGQGPGRPRAGAEALGRLPRARRDGDPRVRRARSHGRHRQRDGRHARARGAGATPRTS